MSTVAYPRLIKRVRAVLIDWIVLTVAAFGTLILGGMLGVSHVYGKVMLVLGVIFVLEPGLVAFTGGTIGHHLQRIRITRADGKGNINIFFAFFRFIVKTLLGWLSFIFVLTTTRHQAVHDLVAGSVVIYKDTKGLPVFEIQAERKLDKATYIYPPAWRRVIVIALYALLLTFALSIVVAGFSTQDCVYVNRCTTTDKFAESAFGLFWLFGFGWLIVHGWNGELYGCRRRKRDSGQIE
jgi:uncharacterized RDD family membrane protein YckC